jgi:hypothetical protein
VAAALFRVTAGHAMVADFQPGVAMMAQQLLSNASLMQVPDAVCIARARDRCVGSLCVAHSAAEALSY